MNDSVPGNAGAKEMVDDIVMEDCSDGDIDTVESRKGNVLKGKQPETSGTSEEDEADGDYHSPNSTPPPRSDEIDRWQYHIDLQEWGQSLHEAAKAVFPNVASSRYRDVYVLMLKWQAEDPELPVSYDIPKLSHVFKDTFGFKTELWEIPDDDKHCHRKVAQKIIDFSMLGGDSKEDLKILYYAGHGKITKNRTLSWTSWRNDKTMKCPTVKWSGIQATLEEAVSDVLLLLDCCNAGIASTDEGQGLTELLSACPYNSKANGVGYYSFTHALVLELAALALRPSFSVGDLYSSIYRRTQSRIPDDELGTERHPAPVHVVLTCDSRFPRGIQLSPRKRPRNSEEPAPVPEAINLSQSSSDVKPQKDEKVPRLLLAIRLQNDLSLSELSTDLFAEWLRDMPIVARQVKVEAGFDSFSTLLIVSIPISLSGYLPQDPAVVPLGPVLSSNLISPVWLKNQIMLPQTHMTDEQDLTEINRSRLATYTAYSGRLFDVESLESGYHSGSEQSWSREMATSRGSRPREDRSSNSKAEAEAAVSKASPPSTSISSTKKGEMDIKPSRRKSTRAVPGSPASTLEWKAEPAVKGHFSSVGILAAAGALVGTTLSSVATHKKSREYNSSATHSQAATGTKGLKRSKAASLGTRTGSHLDVVLEESRITAFGPPASFLFIVNELPTNDDPDVAGSIPARIVEGRYYPPEITQGFFHPLPGYVFRWTDGVVTHASGYTWSTQQIGDLPYAQGTIHANSAAGTIWPEYYTAATVFYTNHFNKFVAARGDASTRDIAGAESAPEATWQPLSFSHQNNVSYVQYSGDQDFLAVRQASWIEQLLPNAYRRRSKDGPTSGGLAGLLPIIIALIAFSCIDREELYRILLEDRAWRGYRWVPHSRAPGRFERRGMVVTVFLDPENPQGSTVETISALELGPTPIFR